MYALFKIEVNKISLIVTIDSTINWVSLNLNNNDIEEFILHPYDKLLCLDIPTNKEVEVCVKDIDENNHRIRINGNSYVILHKIKL